MPAPPPRMRRLALPLTRLLADTHATIKSLKTEPLWGGEAGSVSREVSINSLVKKEILDFVYFTSRVYLPP
jgi:hypothetical protein